MNKLTKLAATSLIVIVFGFSGVSVSYAGAPAWPTVGVGQKVFMYPSCRLFDSRLSTPIGSPIDGKVHLFATTTHPLNSGQTENCAADTDAVAISIVISTINHLSGGYTKLSTGQEGTIFTGPYVSQLYNSNVMSSSFVEVTLCTESECTYDFVLDTSSSTDVVVDLVAYYLPIE